MQNNHGGPRTMPRRLMLTAFVVLPAIMAWGLGVGLIATGMADEIEYEPDVVLVMKDKAFHVVKGAGLGPTLPDPTFSLAPGMDVILLLRNEDGVAHEFVSPLLQKVDLRISGRATMVYTYTAAGVRIEPGETAVLRFDVPFASYDQFHFWCNIHGKFLDDTMRGEIFILKQSSRSPGP